MKQIEINEFSENPFKLIGSDWMLITAKKGDKTNMMTASWGGVGILWNKPVATIYVRPQRYTKEFIDNEEYFSLCVLPEEYRQILNYCGTKSGRDEDKIAETKLTIDESEKAPIFKESRLVLICKKLYAQDLTEQSFIDKSLVEKNYKAKDFHTMYIAEIEKILTNN
ncbi:MAG: flavin reductase family protein [Treponema sp.]|jgi:flavin reductase (DIM6/NTAB) family NADH-FMN oxidoreductase RutF|nr:flavin reductase family protein [Treponema sp.]